jgi:hypothetical protein
MQDRLRLGSDRVIFTVNQYLIKCNCNCAKKALIFLLLQTSCCLSHTLCGSPLPPSPTRLLHVDLMPGGFTLTRHILCRVKSSRPLPQLLEVSASLSSAAIMDRHLHNAPVMASPTSSQWSLICTRYTLPVTTAQSHVLAERPSYFP